MENNDPISFEEAHEFAAKIKSIYPSQKVWIEKCMFMNGHEVNTSCSDGTYRKTFKYKESVEDYIRIHSES